MATAKTPDVSKIIKALHAIAGSSRMNLGLHRTESFIEATDAYKLVRVFGTYADAPEYAREYPDTDAIIPTDEPSARLLVDVQYLADTAKALLAIHKAQNDKKRALVWLEIPKSATVKPLCFRSDDGIALALLMPRRVE